MHLHLFGAAVLSLFALLASRTSAAGLNTRLYLAICLCAAALGGCYLRPNPSNPLAWQIVLVLSVIVLAGAPVPIQVSREYRLWVAWGTAAILFSLLIGACTVQAAPLRDSALPLLDRAHVELCKIESRTWKNPDMAVSFRGAVGYCQDAPATAAWIVKHAVAYGYLPPVFLYLWDRYGSGEFDGLWTYMLTVRKVNIAISKAYLRWILENRTDNIRSAFYLYHCGQDCDLPMVRDTESWNHAANVYRALYPIAPPRAAVKHQGMVVKR